MINFSIRRLVHDKNLYMEVQYSTARRFSIQALGLAKRWRVT